MLQLSSAAVTKYLTAARQHRCSTAEEQNGSTAALK
jgi:hypothetical protein